MVTRGFIKYLSVAYLILNLFPRSKAEIRIKYSINLSFAWKIFLWLAQFLNFLIDHENLNLQPVENQELWGFTQSTSNM